MSFLRVSQLGWSAVRNLMESTVPTVGVAGSGTNHAVPQSI